MFYKYLLIIYHHPALQELDVWGGDFYTDEFYAAAQQLGPGLTKLNLVHVEELDTRYSGYSTVQFSSVQNKAQYSTEQSIVQYGAVQYSTVQLDTRALALLADSCTNLTTLGFYNCGFREPGAGAGAGAGLLAADVAARRREQEDEAALALSCSWLDVERLTITSEVGVPEDILYSVMTCNVLSDRSKAADCHHVHVS